MDDRFVGMDVHRAARISAVAHGGQVVAPAATVQLSEQDGQSGWPPLARLLLVVRLEARGEFSISFTHNYQVVAQITFLDQRMG
ncbi:hypothetical protein BH23ACT5_BH23ACT5_15610 [soil metagenome]